MIVFDVWNGTPATSGGMTGREPAAMTIRSAVICSPVDSRSVPGPGELRMRLVQRGVGAVRAVLPAVDGDRIDAPVDPVADVSPAHAVERCVDAEPAGAAYRVGHLRGVDVHLRRDAADVDARSAEGALLDDRDAPIARSGVTSELPEPLPMIARSK